MNWLARLFSPRKTAAQAAVVLPVAPAPMAPPQAAVHSELVAAPVGFLPWLLGCAPLIDGPLTAAEQRAIAALDKTLSLPALPDELLPRAAALIPQLLAMLRQSDLPVPALAQRMAKDVVLTAEVMRLASSPYYRAQGGVNDLSQAISLIGITGLNTVISRVVLKPIYEAAPGPLSARASVRLWEHAQALAARTATEASGAGLSAFDGYLTGLLHGSGWTIALRAIDRAAITVPLPPTAGFAVACSERAHRLFGLAAERWNITPGFSALGADARDVPLATSSNSLAVALCRAQASAMADVAPGTATDGSPPASDT
jgi:hypothetical protein